jgi:DNA-binding MarR family transcriptional regulator
LSVGILRLVKTTLSAGELRAWQALLHAHHDVTRRLDGELRAEHDISLDAYDVLLRLERTPERELRMTELAERVMIPPSTLTRRVDRLVDAGLVERRRADEDSRVMLARLTDSGRRLLVRAARTHLRGIRQHYTGRLSDDQLASVAEALEVIAGPHHAH